MLTDGKQCLRLKGGNSSMTNQKYKVVNGTSYHIGTTDEMVKELEKIRCAGLRVLLDYGDVETGQSWGEVFDTAGTIGRSMGPTKIPILLHNIRSTGGSGILDDCIVRILGSRDRNVIYKHPNYKEPLVDHVLEVDVGGD